MLFCPPVISTLFSHLQLLLKSPGRTLKLPYPRTLAHPCPLIISACSEWSRNVIILVTASSHYILTTIFKLQFSLTILIDFKSVNRGHLGVALEIYDSSRNFFK